MARELERAGLEYKVTGGTSAALHGVWLPVKDLDLEMSAEEAYRFQQLFQEYAIQPVALSESASYRSHFGKFEIDGVSLEVMGDLQRREGELWKPTWTRTLDLIDLEGVLGAGFLAGGGDSGLYPPRPAGARRPVSAEMRPGAPDPAVARPRTVRGALDAARVYCV